MNQSLHLAIVRRWRLIATVTAAAALAGSGVILAAPPANPGAAVAYHTVVTSRVLDTREGSGAPLGANATRDFVISGLPADASAVSLNVTVVDGTNGSFLVVYPTHDARPSTSTVNWDSAGAVANSATVALHSDDSLRLYNLKGSVNVVIDLVGYYSPSPAGSDGADGADGADGVDGAKGATGSTGLTGATGSQGIIGLTGNTGAQGAIGNTGLTGAAGATGGQGLIGLTGNTGAQGAIGNTGGAGVVGPIGVTGTTGAAGSAGPQGPAGQNAPGFVTTQVVGGDSSVCGNDWANDTYTRTLQFIPQDNGSIQVVRLYDGTFTTIPGVAGPMGPCDETQEGGIMGTFTGFDVVVVTGGVFTPKATCTTPCTTAAMRAAFFPTAPGGVAATSTVNNGWEYSYDAGNRGTWINSSAARNGNVGAIQG